MLSDSELVKTINAFAASISSEPIGLAYHKPEKYAEHTRCFENSIKKMSLDGGAVQFGWIFSHRFPGNLKNSKGYLMATHHAVWYSTDGSLIDVTPLNPDPKHQPFRPNGNILFLMDSKAEPVIIGNYIAPRPIIFYPVEDEVNLVSYVKKLNEREVASCKSMYLELANNSN